MLFWGVYLVVGPKSFTSKLRETCCFCCQVLERISTKEKLNQAQFKLKLPVLFFKLGLAVYVAFVMYICVSLHRIAYDKGDENCVLCASQSNLVSLCSSIAVLGIRFFTKAFPNWKRFSPHIYIHSFLMYCNCFVWSFLKTQTMQFFRLAVSSPAKAAESMYTTKIYRVCL